MNRILWYLSRWWAHTWAAIKSPQTWVSLAVILGLLGVFAHFTQESKREFFEQSYHYVRAGEYQKGWDEFKKALGSKSISKLLRAGHGAIAVILSKPGGSSPSAGNFQPPKHQSSTSPGHVSSDVEDPLRHRSDPNRSNNFPWGILLVSILGGVAVGVAIYLIKTGASYEFEFKWRVQDQEYTGKFECKDEADLKRHLQTKGGELLEVLKKIKVAFEPAYSFGPSPSGGMRKCPSCAKEIKAGAVRCPPPCGFGFAIEPQPANRKTAWMTHLAWSVIGFYVFFVLVWLVWGGVLLLSAH